MILYLLRFRGLAVERQANSRPFIYKTLYDLVKGFKGNSHVKGERHKPKAKTSQPYPSTAEVSGSTSQPMVFTMVSLTAQEDDISSLEESP